MKGTLVNEWSARNKNGVMQTNYAYKLTGTEQEIADAQGTVSAKTIADKDGKNGVKTGDSLWITSQYEGESLAKLVITKANRIAVDRSDERKMLALASRYGKLGQGIIADHIQSQLRKADVEVTVASKDEVKVAVDNLDLD